MRPSLRSTSYPADTYRPARAWAAEYPVDVLVADFSLACTRRPDDASAPATGTRRRGDADLDVELE